jgi:N-acetylmuramoyl-L-alanine amidase
MAKLDYLVIHCTDTPAGRKITDKDIRRWHMGDKAQGHRGWDRVGYSDMIYLDGSLINLTPFNQDNKIDPWEMTWGAKGVNARSRHIVYVGGQRRTVVRDDAGEVPHVVRCDTRTVSQQDTMAVYIRYMIKRHPDIQIAGHYHFASKPCPSFDVEKWLEGLGIPEKNIYRDG